MTVTAIVLAGGRSSRFGGDKLAAPFAGVSVLAATIASLAPVVDEMIVAGPRLPDGFDAGDVPVALVADDEPFGGPLVALAHALVSAGTASAFDVAIVAAGDMPRPARSVLAAMLDLLDVDPTVDAVYLGLPVDGSASRGGPPPRRQVLPLAIRTEAAARAARDAVAAGDRSLQALVDRMAHAELPVERWLRLDPDAETLIDVDTRDDLDRLR